MASFTTAQEFETSHRTLHETFKTGLTKSVKWRKWQLKQLWWMLEENESRFLEALKSDLHRHPFESMFMEIRGTKGDLVSMLESVEKWAKGEKPDAGIFMGTVGKAWLRKEPLGVALIIGAWNFPLYTLLSPAIAAIAAGNCVLLKPSELAPATQDLLAELSPKYLDNSAIRVVTGGPTEVTHMLTLKFNHIFYTGGGKVGRLIAAAAAKNLTPIVLELGGQAPVIVGKSANIDIAAKRIAAAKITNVGQICLNANHVFADPSVHDQLLERLIYWNKQFLQNGNEDTARIINERHFDRVSSLLKSTSGEIVFGGKLDRQQKFVEPTIVKDLKTDDSLLSEELFAPILPVMLADVDQAISTIGSMPHPLGLYIFSSDEKEIQKILDNTSSGGVTINDIAFHAAVPNAPFGGVGDSGYGSYHGKYGFDAFSHTRTVVSVPGWLERVLGFRYLPYDMKNVEKFAIKSKLVGKPGETMDEQTVGKQYTIASLATNVIMAAAVIAAVDTASGGRFAVVKTLREAMSRLRLN